MSSPRRRDGSDRGRTGRPRAGGPTPGNRGRSGAGGGRDKRGAPPVRNRPDRDGPGGRATRPGRPAAPAPEPQTTEVPIPDDADPFLLDRSVRAELRSLTKPNADAVGKYLVAAGELVDTDPVRALAYARAARGRAARVAAVREAVGIAAYHAGEWAEALSELRAARRMSGDPRNLPVIADCERALGRPEQAARALGESDVRRLDPETRAELFIVVAGARRDLGQLDAALSVLSRGGLDRERPRPGAARLWYAYADTLVAMKRTDEAAQWFAASAALDPAGELDAAERAADLL